MSIRAATLTDMPAMVALSAQRRHALAHQQPVFWQQAANADAKQLHYFQRLLTEEQSIALVFEGETAIEGFIIGVMQAAPPVYDPGGPLCMIDDFMVADIGAWQSIGHALLDAVQAEAKERGAVLVIVVCGHHETALRNVLTSAECTLASEWWVGAL